MVEPELSPKKEYLTLAGMIVFAILIAIFLMLFLGLWGRGFELKDIIYKYQTYGIMILGAVILLSALVFIKVTTKGRVGEVIIHHPENSILGKLGKIPRVIKNPLRLTILCFMLFLPMGILATQYNTFLVIPLTLQQITPLADIGFSTEPAAISESLFLMALISLGLTGLKYLLMKKGKFNWGLYIGLAIPLIVIISVVSWYGLHQLVYGGLEKQLRGVLLFGLTGGIMTAVTFTAIPWWVYHFINNLFFRLNELFSDERILIVGGLFIILFEIFGFIYLLGGKKKKIET